MSRDPPGMIVNCSKRRSLFARCANADEVPRDRDDARYRHNRVTGTIKLPGLFGRDAVGVGDALDPLFDVSQHIEAGFKCLGPDILQHIGRDGVP